jgi:hypothetical protein
LETLKCHSFQIDLRIKRLGFTQEACHDVINMETVSGRIHSRVYLLFTQLSMLSVFESKPVTQRNGRVNALAEREENLAHKRTLLLHRDTPLTI